VRGESAIIRDDELETEISNIKSAGYSVVMIDLNPGIEDSHFRRYSYDIIFKPENNVSGIRLGYIIPAQNGHYCIALNQEIGALLDLSWE
jgi:hypothetical protein